MADLSELLARKLVAWINADAELNEAIALVLERLSAFRDADSPVYSTLAPEVQLMLSHISASHHANTLTLYASLIEKIERFERADSSDVNQASGKPAPERPSPNMTSDTTDVDRAAASH